MSTKIYNAYLVCVSTHELLSKLTILKQEWNKSIASKITAEIISKIFEDIINKGKVKVTRKVFLRKLREYHSTFKSDFLAYRECSYNGFEGKLFNEYDLKQFDGSIVLYQYDNKDYLQMFGSQEFLEYAREFFSDSISDFHYQNQTDIPEDIDEKDYELRNKVWNQIFGKNSIPAECGLVIDFPIMLSYFNLVMLSQTSEVIEKIAEELFISVKWFILDQEWKKYLVNNKLENGVNAWAEYDSFYKKNKERIIKEAEQKMKEVKLLDILEVKSND